MKEKKEIRFQLLLTKSQKEALSKAAKANNVSIGELIRSNILGYAMRNNDTDTVHKLCNSISF